MNGCRRQGQHHIEQEGLVLQLDRERALVFFRDLAHAAQPEAVVVGIALGRERQAVVVVAQQDDALTDELTGEFLLIGNQLVMA